MKYILLLLLILLLPFNAYAGISYSKASTSDHGELTGLGDNDHPQYQGRNVWCWAVANNATSNLCGSGAGGNLTSSNCTGGSDTTYQEQSRMPVAGVVSLLKAKVDGAPDNGGGTQSWVYTLVVNGSASSLTCSISETNKECDDLVNTVSISINDDIGFTVTGSGTPATMSGPSSACVQFRPTVTA